MKEEGGRRRSSIAMSRTGEALDDMLGPAFARL
jgi:hypothetical protein